MPDFFRFTCQKLEKSISQYFLIEILIGKSCRQDLAKNWKIYKVPRNIVDDFSLMGSIETCRLPQKFWKNAGKKTNELEDGMPDDFPVTPAKS